MGNAVVSYVQSKNHFAEQPNARAQQARRATRSVPLNEHHEAPTPPARSPLTTPSPVVERTVSRAERTSTANAVVPTGVSTSQVAPLPPAPMSISTEDMSRGGEEDGSGGGGAPVAGGERTARLPHRQPFCFTRPGMEGWGDASAGRWHVMNGLAPHDHGDVRACVGPDGRAFLPLPSWSRPDRKTAAPTAGTAAARSDNSTPAEVDGVSSSEPPLAEPPRTSGVAEQETTHNDTHTDSRLLAGSGSSPHANDTHGGVTVDEDAEEVEDDVEGAVPLLGTMDCADAHAYFYPADSVYATSDSATYRHPDTLWLRSQSELRAAYTHGNGKQQHQQQSSTSRDEERTRRFVSIAEELRRSAERRPDALALSWRNVERLVRTSATNCTYYMSVPQYLTCGALSAHVQAFRLGLRSLGVCAGDGIGLVERSRWEWLVTCYAAWSLGLVVTVVPPELRCVRQAVLEASDAVTCVVCASATLPLLHRCYDERDTVAQEEASQAEEACQAGGRAGSRPSRRPPRPRPLFIVMRGDEDGGDMRGTGSGSGGSSPAQTHGVVGVADREEEALWWGDVMEAGRAVLYDVVTRLAHQRRLRGQPYPRRLMYSRCTPVRATDLAMVVYTEGGARGVLLTHGAIRAAVASHAEYLQEAGLVNTTTTTAEDADNDNEDDDEPDTDEEAEKADVEEAVLHRLSSASPTPTSEGPSCLAPSSPPTTSPGRTSRVTAPATGSAAGGAGVSRLPNSSSAVLSRVLLAAVHGDVRSSTSEALTGFQVWWQQQQAFVRSHLSQHLGGGNGSGAKPTYVLCEPLHRVRELILVTTLLVRADMTVCFGRPETLLDHHTVHPCSDVKVYKPILLSLPPDTLESVGHNVEAAVKTRGYSAVLFAEGYQGRRRALQRGLDTPYLNTSVFTQTQQLLGGRCKLVISHGVALAPRVQQYIQVVCGAAVVQWLTLTEACGCGLAQLPWDGLTDSVGGPMGAVEMKLRDVPRDGQLWPCHLCDAGGGQGHDDDEPLVWAMASGSTSGSCQSRSHARPFAQRPHPDDRVRHVRQEAWWLHDDGIPAGELLLRGPTVFCGYHAQPERTVAALDRSGWLHTSDVVQRNHGNNLGSFRVVDRLHTRAKTSSSCVVELEMVEAIYASHPLCDDEGVCVLVHPYRNAVAALVVTSEPRVRAFYRSAECQNALQRMAEATAVHHAASASADQPPQPHELSNPYHSSFTFAWSAIFSDPRLHAAAAESLFHWGVKHQLPHHACIQRVQLVYDDWTRLRTATGKLRREAIYRHYAPLIEELFRS